MKTIVITGSTRGIGFGLAEAFLALGCGVAVSGRTREGVESALAELGDRYGQEKLFGYPCDVSQPDQVQALWDAAKAHFGRLDIWINNAGIAHAQMAFRELSPEQMAGVVSANLLGAMYGSRVALNGMFAQGSGCLYNMGGHGSNGRKQDGLTLYGTTKYALRYLSESLVAEVSGTPVIVGEILPGMVVTDLLVGQFKERPQEWEEARRIFNILADRVETVAPWLAERILANRKNGARISWYTRPKLLGRFLMAPFRRRDVVGSLESYENRS